MRRNLNVAIVGSGLVASEIIMQLNERKFPMESLKIFGRTERKISAHTRGTTLGALHQVDVVSNTSFTGMDIAFFAGTEGEKGASVQFAKYAVAAGCYVIDNGSDFRLNSSVPLIIPEVNPWHLDQRRKLIANPNCSTIIMLTVVGPLHRVFGLKRIVVTTYQSVSGSGSAGIRELETQAGLYTNAMSVDDLAPLAYPAPIASNVIPFIGDTDDEGVTTEEAKMEAESRKILGTCSFDVFATCLRVPVLRGHGMALHLEFKETVYVSQVCEVLKGRQDICISPCPTPLATLDNDHVQVGRIRQRVGYPKTIDMVVTGDNLGKGAALNAVQIAEAILPFFE